MKEIREPKDFKVYSHYVVKGIQIYRLQNGTHSNSTEDWVKLPN